MNAFTPSSENFLARTLGRAILAFLLPLAAFGAQPGAAATPAQPAGKTTAAGNITSDFKPVLPLRVAVDPSSPPIIFKTGEKFSGMEAEFARGFAEYLGRPLVMVVAPWSDLIPALLDDRADIIMSGMSITRLRQIRISFCLPYLRMGQVPLCRRTDYSLFNNNANLNNVRSAVGVVTGSTGDTLVGSQFSYAKRVTFSTQAEAVKALLDKRVDLVVIDYPLALWISAENESAIALVPALLTEEDLGWAVRKDDDELRAAADAYLTKLKLSGKLAEIVRKWLPDTADTAIAPAPMSSTAIPTTATPGVGLTSTIVPSAGATPASGNSTATAPKPPGTQIVGEVKAISGGASFDQYAPYLKHVAERINAQIEMSAKRFLSNTPVKGLVLVNVLVNAKGEVDAVQIAQSNASQSLNDLCGEVIMKAAPFGVWSPDMEKKIGSSQTLNIILGFD